MSDLSQDAAQVSSEHQGREQRYIEGLALGFFVGVTIGAAAVELWWVW